MQTKRWAPISDQGNSEPHPQKGIRRWVKTGSWLRSLMYLKKVKVKKPIPQCYIS
jgi:hypothetical protein